MLKSEDTIGDANRHHDAARSDGCCDLICTPVVNDTLSRSSLDPALAGGVIPQAARRPS
jgi:hypothetical protein